MKLRTQRQQERHDNILNAARKLIAERGYQGVTMRDLALASSVTLKTLYHQFDNKENLLATAVIDRYQNVYHSMSLTEKETGFDKLMFILQATTDAMTENIPYAKALAPFLGSDSKKTEFINIPLQTFHQALRQIGDEGELQSWISLEHLALLIYRQGMALFQAWSRGEVSLEYYTYIAKLDICLALSSVTTGTTQHRAITQAKELQAKLQHQSYYARFEFTV